MMRATWPGRPHHWPIGRRRGLSFVRAIRISYSKNINTDASRSRDLRRAPGRGVPLLPPSLCARHVPRDASCHGRRLPGLSPTVIASSVGQNDPLLLPHDGVPPLVFLPVPALPGQTGYGAQHEPEHDFLRCGHLIRHSSSFKHGRSPNDLLSDGHERVRAIFFQRFLRPREHSSAWNWRENRRV